MILVTGGLGFIGSHTCVELSNNNYDIIIVDNLNNSKIEVLDKINQLTNKDNKFYQYDLLDYSNLEKVFSENKIDSIIHFAGYKAVSESIQKPIEYYENNIQSTLNLLKLCKKYNVNNFIFSSSATVYGSSKAPLNENSQIGIGITNPYGTTKFYIEQILKDVCISDDQMNVTILRYFNPVGSHESGLIGEDPKGIPNNLMPFILKVAIKNNTTSTLDDVYNTLKIFGVNYDTSDGTAIRDFIHVVDLAKAHLAALNKKNEGFNFYNVGSGKGSTVKQVVDKMIEVNNISLPYEIVGRRPGDLDIVYCETNKIYQELNWKCEKSLDDICRDSYNFAKQNF